VSDQGQTSPQSLTFAERAQLVALELIRRAIVNTPANLAANLGRFVGQQAARQTVTATAQPTTTAASHPEVSPSSARAAREAKEASPLYQMGKALAAEFRTVLGPLGVFAQVLQSSASGLQLVASSAKILATSLAPVLLPVSVALATGFLALSDVVWQEVLPNLEDFFGFVLNVAIPAIEILAESFVDAAGIVADFAQWVERQIDSLDPTADSGELTAKQAAERDQLAGRFARDADTGAGDYDGPGSGGDFGGGGGQGEAFFSGVARGVEAGLSRGRSRSDGPATVDGPTRGERATKNALGDVLKELRQSIGPSASISGLTQIGQAAQLAALNQSPFEARVLRMMDQMLTAMNRAARNTERQAGGGYYDTGAGDYDGGGSSGGNF